MRSEPYVTPDSLEVRTGKWLGFIRQRVRPRPDLILRPEKCALLVIDMLRYFADPRGRAYLPASRAVVPRMALLLDLWRTLGAKVVYTRHCHRNASELGMLGRFFSDHIDCSEWDSEIVDELSPVTGEQVLRKTTYDSFHGTGLEEHLKSEGVEQVLVTGVLTQLCCETTARSAFVRGFEVYITADGTASTTEELHMGSLLGLASGFAVVGGTSEIIGDHENR